MTAVPAEHEPEDRPALRVLPSVGGDDRLGDYIARLVDAAPDFSPEIRAAVTRIIG